MRSLDEQKRARDKQLVVKQTTTRSGKEKIVVKPIRSWENNGENDSTSSGHYNTSSATQILEKSIGVTESKGIGTENNSKGDKERSSNDRQDKELLFEVRLNISCVAIVVVSFINVNSTA